MVCVVPDDVIYYISRGWNCQLLFCIFLQKNPAGQGCPAGRGMLQVGKNPKTYAFAFCGSKICGATRIRITTRTVVRMASGSM